MSIKFCHLHCHTTYSLLDGAASIPALIRQTKLLGMEALAITDHGNMFGVPQFVQVAQQEGIKPIIGCECYVASDMHDHKDKKRYHQLLLAKNAIGYQNLIKLCSLGFIEGYYYKPRIDKKTIKKYAEGLIATTCCLAAEVPQAIMEQGEEVAEQVFLSWLDIFGQDYYIELQRHGIPEQDKCNSILVKWSKKHNVKIIATNDVHYIKKEESLAQDILLCLQTSKNFDDPKRMRFTGNQFYLKSPQEMLDTFSDLPEAVHNTQEIVDKVETPSLQRKLLMPVFKVPSSFRNQEEYLRHLTFAGAKKRYGTLSATIEKRIQYELDTILKMGFAGYFLIVQDMVNAAKNLGVFVGPGRGSVAGSVVAYALRITDIDPLEYNLLFERFLNPERISMPDIDLDFEDEGRQAVIDYLVNKYGYDQVAQIITFSTMGPKLAIRDVSRVLGLPLAKADAMAKLIPEKIGITLPQALAQTPELKNYLKKTESLESKVLTISQTLEGSPRHHSIHAAGLIIAFQKLIDLIPVKKDKNTNLLVTQYDGSVIESVGLLKMDLLGLRTLSIIRDTLRLIKKVHNKEIGITKLPLDDPATFELYRTGSTVGVFQFESENMRAYLRQLLPTKIGHLIAINALYRPGPMKNISTYIARMHGKEKVDYMHPSLKPVLESTYGIPVYQEQIMQMAQVIAGYSLGEADILRRAMGKKKRDEMQKQQAIFIKGAKEKHGIETKKAKEIFDTMIHFAEYGFNLSHSAAYTLLSYQTAYLKAHYPTAFMASLLIHNQRNMDKITFFIEECKRMQIEIKGPNVNESQMQFSNDANRTIYFGLAAIKGVGEKAVETLIAEREKNGAFKNLNDLVYRLIGAAPSKPPSKKVLETLALAGAFDKLEQYHRKQYLYTEKGKPTFLEQVLQYQQKRYKQKHSAQQSLFSLSPSMSQAQAPLPPACSSYTMQEKLKKEKELVGFYISGHPLDTFQLALKHFCTGDTKKVNKAYNRRKMSLGGIIQQATHRQNSKGIHFGIITLEDYKGTLDIMLFGETYHKYRHLLIEDHFIYLKGQVQQRYGRSDQWEFRPETIAPLDSVQIKSSHKILQLKIPLKTLSNTLVDKLTQLLQQYPGQCPVQILLFHAPTESFVYTTVQNHQIALKEALFEELKTERIPYELSQMA